MSPTIRQTLMEMLGRGEFSALDLARTLLLTQREIEEHLPHLARSLGKRLRVRPAQCRLCGHVFARRSRLDTPGRCPVCRGELVEGPWFHLTGSPSVQAQPEKN